MKEADRISAYKSSSVWLEFSPLAAATNSINLGQGFPDWAPPEFVQKSALNSVTGVSYSTYARSAGHKSLVEAVAKQYEPLLNQEIDPYKNIIVTVGASEALYLSIMSFINKDDEVITIEPAFDLYYGALEMAQAKIVPIPLTQENSMVENANNFKLDFELLQKSLSSKTKAIILNTPHNPTGKVFSQDEINKLATILKGFPNCLVISDEVYEHIVYKGNQHIPLASHPDLKNKTIVIYSAGKTFSVTGWKIGWAIGAKELIEKLQFTQQWVVFSVSTPHQQTIAEALINAQTPYKNENSYFEWIKKTYENKRDILYTGLQEAGFNPVLPQGSFFILCNIRDKEINNKEVQIELNKLKSSFHISIDEKTLELKDYNYSRFLTINKKVTAIPCSAFFQEQNKHIGESWIRLAFCKDDQALTKAIELLS